MVFWGKSENIKTDFHYLTVWEHSLNVAAVAEVWMRHRPGLLDRWTELICLPKNKEGRKDALYTALYFISNHDLGKYSLKFQYKNPDLFRQINPGFSESTDFKKSERFDHGKWGLIYYSRHHGIIGRPKNVSEITGLGFWLMMAVASHHGSYTNDIMKQTIPPVSGEFDKIANQAAAEHIRKTGILFPLPVKTPKKVTAAAAVFLAGLCSVSDWLGSDTEFFPCKPVSDCKLPENLAESLTDAALRALEHYHFLGRYCGKPENRTDRIFPKEKQPVSLRPLQNAVLDMHLAETPQTVLIEAPMGEGKTEAAMIIADRLLSAGYAEKLFFALPTMATSNAMYDRMSQMMKGYRFFDSNSAFVLAHSKRHIDDTFQQRILVRKPDISELDDTAQMACAKFFASSHKRSLLAQVGVGTVDQVMSAALCVRHHWVKLFALANSVIIIDEIHAYDAYMQHIISGLLEWLHVLGSHVIMLSATLPETVRAKLASSGKSESSADYPLITHWADNTLQQHIRFTAESSEKPGQRFCLATPEKAITRSVDYAKAGAQVCIILNTVAKAQELFSLLSVPGITNSVELLLFHSRFMQKHRSETEETVVSIFGKNGDRSRGRILIATQLVEQSLDVDFDFIASELAPIDLLFQRIGREHRFSDFNKFRMNTEWAAPEMCVFFFCDNISGIMDDRKQNRLARSVYDPVILYRTALLLQNTNGVLLGIRKPVDTVYSGQDMNIPESDRSRHDILWNEWENSEHRKRNWAAYANQASPDDSPTKLSHKSECNYDDTEFNELDDTEFDRPYFGTRLVDETVSIVFADMEWLVQKENFKDQPELYTDFLKKTDVHSVNVLKYMISDIISDNYVSDGNEWQTVLKSFRNELPKWREYLILPMPDTDKKTRYSFSGSLTEITYSRETGLEIKFGTEQEKIFNFSMSVFQEDISISETSETMSQSEPDKEIKYPVSSRRPKAPTEDLKSKVRSNPLKGRISYLHVEKARLDVHDSGLVMTAADGEAFRQIPVASLSLILLEPGSVVTHEAVKLCAHHKCLLMWVGEGGVRLYSAGYSDFARSDKILHQAHMFLDPKQRLAVVRRMFEIRFKTVSPKNKSINQLRSMEAHRVKKQYRTLSEKFGVSWNGRFYDTGNWENADVINRVISSGTSCLYGIVEAAILTAGYSPAIGFLHSGKDRSFVYDIADLYKDGMVLPLCFELVKENELSAETMIRHKLRDVFKNERFLETLIPDIERILEPIEKGKQK